MAKAVFLDRDETVNPDPGYISNPDHFELYPWVPAELAKLKKAGFLLVVVTNQSGIGRGLVEWANLNAIHEKMNALLLSQAMIQIDEFAICPHTPSDQCDCRKPKPTLILNAALKYQIQLSESFLLGDRKTDVEAGNAAQLKKSFLVIPGDEHTFKAAIAEILNLSTL